MWERVRLTTTDRNAMKRWIFGWNVQIQLPSSNDQPSPLLDRLMAQILQPHPNHVFHVSGLVPAKPTEPNRGRPQV